MTSALDIEVPEMPRGLKRDCMKDQACEPLIHVVDHLSGLTLALRKLADNQAELTGKIMAMQGELKGALTAIDTVTKTFGMTTEIAKDAGYRAAQESVPDLVEEAERSRRLLSQRVKAEKRQRTWEEWRGYAQHTAVDWIVKAALGAVTFGGIEEFIRRVWHH